MDPALLAFAIAAGSVAALNPCGFAMLPAYLALVVSGDGGVERGRLAALGRALAATAAMTAGFLLVFGGFGLVLAPVLGAVQRYLPVVTVVIGVGLVGLGIAMLAGREPALFRRRPGRAAPTTRLGSMFGYGLAYAMASLSCTIGPFLAVTGAGMGSGSPLDTVGAFLAYGAGMALVVGVLAAGVAVAGDAVAARARRLLPYVNRASGAVLLLVGVWVGYYGIYELRVAAGADGADPVVDSAAAVQQALAGWVGRVGVGPLLTTLTALVLMTMLLAMLRRRSAAAAAREPKRDPTTPSGRTPER